MIGGSFRFLSQSVFCALDHDVLPLFIRLLVFLVWTHNEEVHTDLTVVNVVNTPNLASAHSKIIILVLIPSMKGS